MCSAAAAAGEPDGRAGGGDRLVGVTRNTLETAPATTVLVVGGPQVLIELTQSAARSVPPAEVLSCELRDAPTRVAELWPFAIVMSEDLYSFDSAEFDALARDVRARLITVKVDSPTSITQGGDLGDKILEAFRRRLA
jgi:hypothetical protein